jgi:hypothetical protein
VIIAEEGNFIHPKVMKVAICPLVQMRNTVFFFISSKADNNSAQHSGLMNTIRASGVFRIHNVVTVCADCRRSGVIWGCMHAPRPPWKAQAQQMNKVSILMQDEATMARETLNEEIENLTEPAFSHPSLEWIRSGDRWAYHQSFNAEQVFIGIDPACGGSTSRYAIVSGVLHRETPQAAEKLVVRSSTSAR